MTAQAMLRVGDLDGKQITLASQIVSTTKRATQILNDLLDITRSAFGTEMPVSREAMDLGELARSLVAEMRALANNRPIELNLTGDTRGEWDAARIGQIFSNLVGNALQHSETHTPIRVSLAGRGSSVSIAVHNTGPTIPPEKLKRIFETADPGRSGGLAHGNSTHLGLGLFITKKIAMAHGGDVAATSSDEAGTVFSVTLPRSQATNAVPVA